MPIAPVNDLEIYYEDKGSGPVLLLVMGISAQSVIWHPEFVQGYVDRGFRVIIYDHRDIGKSTWLDGAEAPSPLRCIGRRLAQLQVTAPYTLSDMASDAVGLLDHLDIDQAHVMGVSMGGMIAQHLAIEHSARLLSLTSVMSGPGSVRHMVGEIRAIKALLGPKPTSRQTAMDRNEFLFRTVGGKLPIDIDWVRERAGLSWDRGYNPMGFVRHFAAMSASGHRLGTLPSVKVPTTVIHGDSDGLVPLRAGRATARAIPGAQFIEVPDMGHNLSRQTWPLLFEEQLRLEPSLTA